MIYCYCYMGRICGTDGKEHVQGYYESDEPINSPEHWEAFLENTQKDYKMVIASVSFLGTRKEG